MAQARKPKGLPWDDILKKAAKLAKAGDTDAAKAAFDTAMSRADDMARRNKNKAALVREWDRKLAADKYISRDVQQAKSRREIAKSASRQRGFVSKTTAVGKRQSANQEKALEQAGARAARRAERRAAGGKNAPAKVVSRQKRAARNRKAARPR